MLLCSVGRAGFVADVNHNMEEELMPGRERAQAVRAALAPEGMLQSRSFNWRAQACVFLAEMSGCGLMRDGI